jgi:hypothetical protein
MLMFGGDFGSRKHDRAESEGWGLAPGVFCLGEKKGF